MKISGPTEINFLRYTSFSATFEIAKSQSLYGLRGLVKEIFAIEVSRDVINAMISQLCVAITFARKLLLRCGLKHLKDPKKVIEQKSKSYFAQIFTLDPHISTSQSGVIIIDLLLF